MQEFEKLGLFYLGRRHDITAARTLPEPVLYESRDLVTHAVCVGMTGSGKTGLCLSLIEEAAIDGIPVLAVDPKGDLSNLLLTFPELTPADFRPWVDDDEARRQGLAPDAFAAAEAERWRAGLADWGQDGARIDRLKKAAAFAIYTPGSRAGLPVSILSSFAAPPAGARADGEALADRAGGTATSVLALAGVETEPRSRQHTLLAALFSGSWAEGRSLDLPGLIQQVQSPPFQKIGVLDLEAFFPSKERFDLAMRLNGLLAAPGFEQWLEGASLDPASLLYTEQGKPRVAIMSIAHLGDDERMFFVSLLLNQVVTWMRAQTGTSSLRALLFMDEILGYFPPVANPPSKPPLLTLLKQARAFGLGVVLATQNPADLDYKGLANTGTWFLGRLQTERDKARMLDGLEGAAAGSMDRGDADRLLSTLGKRVFLLHNVHEKAPVVFQSRWALSYLRGPLSRDQIHSLMATRKGQAVQKVQEVQEVQKVQEVREVQQVQKVQEVQAVQAAPPVLPPGIQQFFIPRSPIPDPRSPIRYAPFVIGAARVGFGDPKLGVDEVRDVLYAVPIREGAVAVDWAAAVRRDEAASDLVNAPEAVGTFAPLPPAGAKAKNYALWAKDFPRWLAQSERLELLRNRDLKMTSRSGETERDFKVRLLEKQRAVRDQAVDDVRRKYASKQAQLENQRRRAEAVVERESAQASQQKIQTGVSVGATILGALFGRKAGTVGRATTAARGVSRSLKETDDIRRATESLEATREKERALEEEILAETKRIGEMFEAQPAVDRVSLAPRRGQISVQVVGLGWISLEA